MPIYMDIKRREDAWEFHVNTEQSSNREQWEHRRSPTIMSKTMLSACARGYVTSNLFSLPDIQMPVFEFISYCKRVETALESEIERARALFAPDMIELTSWFVQNVTNIGCSLTGSPLIMDAIVRLMSRYCLLWSSLDGAKLDESCC